MIPLLTRHEKNPLLKPTKHAWENKWVFNCGATVYKGKVLLLYRAQGTDMVSRLGLTTLKDGVRVDERLSTPVLEPDPTSEHEVAGVEDPRITQTGETYYITYTAASHYQPLVSHESRPALPGIPGALPWRTRVSLAYTNDFRSFNRHGVVIKHIDSKDAVLFPIKVNNQYVLLHRVFPQMRFATSSDFFEFHERGIFMWPRPGMWDNNRIGAGAQPLKTPFGWLLIYHGVDEELVYRLGLAVTDLADPSRLIARSDEPVLEPSAPYEKEGNVSNVVFTCGAVEWGNQFLVYYGAADHVVALATVGKEEVYTWIKGELKRDRSPEELSGTPER